MKNTSMGFCLFWWHYYFGEFALTICEVMFVGRALFGISREQVSDGYDLWALDLLWFHVIGDGFAR